MARLSGADDPEARGGARTQDIVGLVLLFGGAALLLWMLWPQHAPVPCLAVAALRLLAGSGAYVIPIALLYTGAMFLAGFDQLRLSRSTYGSLLLFFCFLAWRQLVVPATPVGPAIDPFWSEEHVTGAGGYVGAALAALLVRPLGALGAYLALALVACVAVVLLVDRPVPEIIAILRSRFRAAGQRVSELCRRSARALSTRKEKKRLEAESKTSSVEPAPPTSVVPARTRRRAPKAEPAPEPEAPADQPAQGEPDSPAPSTEPAIESDEGTATPAYTPPSLDLLAQAPPAPKWNREESEDRKHVIETTLQQFHIKADVLEIARGPSVTRYEVHLGPGVKVSKIVSLADNLAMSLEAIDVRVEAPIPGKSAIGVEVPNVTRSVVSLRECLEAPEFTGSGHLTFVLGKDVTGSVQVADLTRMPHLLVGGSTNSGKSVCLNALIASLVFRSSPEDVRMILVDPKRVELSLWDGIPHLLQPVVQDVAGASAALRGLLREMDARYERLVRAGARNITGYNHSAPPDERMPYIVLVVDELADLMMQAASEVETSIARLAQLARATGIHLVIATQRPSVDVITGTIKANIPSRIAFAVSSQIDSRTILDMSGAERLIGRGDMLFLPIDAAKPVRIQGCFLSETETNTLVDYLRTQDQPEYTMAAIQAEGEEDEPSDESVDELFAEAVRYIAKNGQASTSLLQRKLRIGFNRAARLLDEMEERGLVSPQDRSKSRELLITQEEALRRYPE